LDSGVAASQVEGPLFASAAAPSSLAPQTRIALTPEGERQAEERLAILQPLLDYIHNPGGRARFAQLRLADGRRVTSSDLLAMYLAETHSQTGLRISRATLWSWKKAYTEGGFNALAPKVRSDKGTSRWFAQNPDAAKLVASVYLKPYQTVQTAYNALLREHEMLGVSAAELPSYETVRSFLDTLPKPISVLAREGERAHSERMSLYLQRGYDDVAANQIWVSDHMIHDVFVWNDCFPSETEGRQMRLRLTMILDMRTRKPVGYSWTPEGSSNSIKSALRRAVMAYGPCESFYCDNGRDFQKVARGGSLLGITDQDAQLLDAELAEIDRRGVLTRLGIPTQHCLKYHPQSKHVERFFRTLHLQFDAKFNAYTTGNAYTRTDAANVLSIQHRKLQKLGLHQESKLMPASVFIQMCAMWLEEVYSNQPHRGKGMDGLTPNEAFEAGYPVAQRRSIAPEALEELLWENKLVRVPSATASTNTSAPKPSACSMYAMPPRRSSSAPSPAILPPWRIAP
jgi:transposase InsO family protein